MRKGEKMDSKKMNEEQMNGKKMGKAFLDVSTLLNKKKYLREVLLALCLAVLVFTVFLIQVFHDAEEFKNTTVVRNLICEQEELVREYNILPNLDSMSADGLAPYFRENAFLDPNYQYKIRVGTNSYQVFSNWNVDYVSTAKEEYIIKSSENSLKNKKTNIYIESYLNKVLTPEGEIYRTYTMFSKIHNNINGMIVFLVVIFVFALALALNLVVFSLKKDERIVEEWRNKIPLELLFCIILVAFFALVAIESGKFEVLSQISYFSYGAMLVELFTCFFVAVIVMETIIFKCANGTQGKNSIIVLIDSFFRRKTKPVYEAMGTKKKTFFAIIAVMVLEVVYLALVIDSNWYGYGSKEKLFVLILLLELGKFFYSLYLYSKFFQVHTITKELQNGEINAKVDTKGMKGILLEHGECINHISDGLKNAIAEKMKSEQLKVELITNVSHDIKTPLTSIINYVDLMKKEETENPKIKEYLDIVDKQSLRLKDLTDNVIEASKAATGNVEVNLTDINVGEMLSQALGEYENKFSKMNLQTVYTPGEMTHIASGDGKLLWRVLDNLFSNVNKYTLEGTRFYINIDETQDFCVISLKNISKYQLNISAEELSQRFVRGDASRNTQGNGLGLSIAQSLMSLQGGELKLDINGDLFVATIYLEKKRDRLEN